MKEGWEIKTLKDVGDIFSGNSINATVKKEKYLNISEGLPYIATKDVGYDSSIDYDNGVRIPFSEKDSFRVAPMNSVLICAEGGSAGRKIGRTNQNICFVNKLFALATEKETTSKYVFYWYNSDTFQNEFKSRIKGLIGGVSKKIFETIPIPIPSLPEQKRIVAKLDQCFEATDQAKANVECNMQNAKELFQIQLNQNFSQKGEDWVEKKLGEICNKISDGVHKKPNYVSDGIPFITIKNLTEGDGISFENVNYITKKDHEFFCKRTKPEKGDILITKDGTIGIVRVVETNIEFSIFVSVALIKPISKQLTPYLKYVLMSPIIQNQIKPKGTALKHLYLKDLREFLIPIPPSIEQKRLVFQFDELSNQTQSLESHYQRELDALDELKKSILQKAFNGELTTTELEATL